VYFNTKFHYFIIDKIVGLDQIVLLSEDINLPPEYVAEIIQILPTKLSGID